MNKPTFTTSEILLNLASRQAVAWTMIKISAFYKYVGLFV